MTAPIRPGFRLRDKLLISVTVLVILLISAILFILNGRLQASTNETLDNDLAKTGMTALMPRMVDQFQAYLRELRLDDLKGSEGVVRLKEELLRRADVAAAPYKVRDVLLKQMIIQ